MTKAGFRRLSSYKLLFLMLFLAFTAIASYDEESDDCSCSGGNTSGIEFTPENSVTLTQSETGTVTALTTSGKSADWDIAEKLYLDVLSLSPSTGPSTTITATAAANFPTWVTSGVTTRVSYTPLAFPVTANEQIGEGATKMLQANFFVNLLPAQVRFDLDKGENCLADAIQAGAIAKIYVLAFDKPDQEYTFSAATTGANPGMASVVGVEQLSPQTAYLLVRGNNLGKFIIKLSGMNSDGQVRFAYERFEVVPLGF